MAQIPTFYSNSSAIAKTKLAIIENYARAPTYFRAPASLSSRLATLESQNQPSYISSQSSSLYLDQTSSGEEEEAVRFPLYDSCGYFEDADNLEPPFGQEPIEFDAVTISANSTSPETPSCFYTADHLFTTRDDTGMREEPTMLIDYLSHNWNEEDIWRSWRHIVEKRESTNECRRLENASWRSWTKSKDQLRTIPPEALNWMKDHNVTWLYGPLLKTNSRPAYSDDCVAVEKNSRGNSFDSIKPILKKPSLSETMLRRSVSSSTLMRQATDSLCAQQRENQAYGPPIVHNRAYSDSWGSSYLGSITTQSATSPLSGQLSVSSSGGECWRIQRHIHFNNEVEQCIAISEGGNDEDLNSTADDEPVEMKPTLREKSTRSCYSPLQNSSSGARNFVAKLPSTTLNYREDTPESIERPIRQDGEARNMNLVYPPAPSQEVLPTCRPMPNFLLVDEDEDADMKWQPPAFPDQRAYGLSSQMHAGESSDDPGDITEGRGIHPVRSHISIPYEDEDEDEDNDNVSHNLLHQVLETVNAARDIAYVIWNVGWTTS